MIRIVFGVASFVLAETGLTDCLPSLSVASARGTWTANVDPLPTEDLHEAPPLPFVLNCAC